ncbi:hypothetical protein UFOVP614_50 [uncultured Caudovirales phage]|uniref:Uncharacterized protein n=1 Tax=uncultured Caudovirales phage TaxID=2100421 RepID=A0A6J5N336_9CAUD|nr:hypothetical protein UFOVP614_50 [uncultured Caudovirales phage]
MSISKNQLKAIREGFFDKIEGGDYTVLNKDELPLLERVLYDYGLAFNDAIKDNLERSGSIATGKLAEPSQPVITKFGNQYTLNLGYPMDSKQIEYYDFINKGVKGYDSGTPGNTPYSFKSPYPNRKMAANIFSWLNNARKSVRADSVATNKKGEIDKSETKKQALKKILSESENKKRLAYAISSSIKKKGIEQTNYFDNAIKQVFNDKFMEDISYALLSDFAIKGAAKISKSIKYNK